MGLAKQTLTLTLTLPLTWAAAGAASVDVAVFCLALMGTDYPAFLREAHRVLRPGGRLWIAEVLARTMLSTWRFRG